MCGVLDFDSARSGRERRPRPVLRGDDVGEFWLEVARHPLDEPLAVEHEHSPRRALTEAFLVLAGAGLVVLAVTAMLPAPTF